MSTRIPVSARLAAIVLAAVMLTACNPFDTRGARRIDIEESPSPAPSVSVPSPDDQTVDLSFAGGPDLPLTVERIEWTDPFVADTRFTVDSPDDGNGGWSYLDTQTQCVISFYQGSISDFDKTSDDLETTDALMLVINGSIEEVTPEIIAQYSEDTLIPVWGTDSGIDARRFGGTGADGSSWVDAVRYFSALDLALYTSISCPAGGVNAYDEYDELLVDHLAAAVTTLE